MNKFSPVIKFVMATSLLITSSELVFAKPSTPSPAPAPSAPVKAAPAVPAASDAPAKIVVDPEQLRQRVLEHNLSLEQELNTVKDQKDNVNVARGKLLPSLNLSFADSGPSFLLSQVQFLLPFLFPSNWFNLYAAENLFDAQKIAYQVLEMNVYSTALSTYFAIQADIKISKVYAQQAQDLMQIYHIKKVMSDQLGIIAPEDLEQALATANLSQVTSSQWSETTAQEIASLRQVMGLPLSTEIEVAEVDMPASDWEEKPVDAMVTQALSVALENRQIDDLIKAAKDGKYSAAFAFLNSGTLTSQGGSGQNASLANLAGGISVHFGFEYFPNLSLSERNVTEVTLQKTSLSQQVSQTMESVKGSVYYASQQYNLAAQAESALTDVFQIAAAKYNSGLGSLLEVLTARSSLAQASYARIKAQEDLNQQRVSLHRAMVTDQFSQIKGCTIMPQPKPGFWSGLIGSHKSDKTIDQMCKEGGSNP